MSQPHPEAERYRTAVHNAALLAVIACPILALLPPRKLDFYTWGLVGVTGYSVSHLAGERRARYVRALPREEEEQQSSSVTSEQRQGSAVGDLQKDMRAREAWKVRRQREIREDVEEGKGFADMIYDQIWEVWNQGKTKDGEEDEGK